MADKVNSGAIDAVSGSDLTIDPKTSRWATGSSSPPHQSVRRLFSAKEKDPVLRTLQRFATVCFIGAAFAALISACGSSDATPPPANPGAAGAPAAGAPAAGAPGTAGAGTAGAGTAGAGTAGAGTAGAGTAGGSAAGGGSGLTGNAANGMALYSASSPGCATCHGPMADGGIGPNITGSKMYGIGNWTQAQFHDAVRMAKDKSGAMFYVLMAPFSESAVSDQGIADLYAFLMSKSVETKNEGSACGSAGTCKGTH